MANRIYIPRANFASSKHNAGSQKFILELRNKDIELAEKEAELQKVRRNHFIFLDTHFCIPRSSKTGAPDRRSKQFKHLSEFE